MRRTWGRTSVAPVLAASLSVNPYGACLVDSVLYSPADLHPLQLLQLFLPIFFGVSKGEGPDGDL